MLIPPGPAETAPDDDPWADEAWPMPLPGERAALEALAWHWGEAYDIGCDEGEWWFRRKDGKGARETASGPDELRSKIVTDYMAYPVTRPGPGPAGGCYPSSGTGGCHA